MYYEKEPFVLQLNRTASAAATFVAQTQPWQPGDVVTIQGVSVVNADSNNKDWSVGVKRYEQDMYIETIDAGNAGVWAYWKGPITIPSDYRVIVRLILPAAGDRYTINIFGYIQRLCRGDVTDGE
jgi:hypothetical protein